MLRKIIWRFLEEFYRDKNMDAVSIFALADRTSDALDNFIVHFSVSFAKHREDVLKSQQAVIKELSVPVIPLFDNIAVFPVIGTLDAERLRFIEERLLDQLENRNMRKLFIDLSGAIIPNEVPLELLEQILDGVALLGCEPVLTGITAKLARTLLRTNRHVLQRISVESTLQQALLAFKTI